MFGAVASTALTLVIVPLMYYQLFRDKPCPEVPGKEEQGKGE
jgi:hypothetical protein